MASKVLDGTSGMDISRVLQNAFHLFRGKLAPNHSGPCDGLVLRIHYRWAFYFSIGGFLTVWYGWYFGKIIHCVILFNASGSARGDYQNICLSYPHVEGTNGEKRYILYYRWIHWSLLFLATLFYLPRNISKSIENPKAKKIIEDLATLSPRYDQAERDMVQRATYYMVTNMKTHDQLYYKYLSLNIFTLIIDIFVLLFLDFIFHNRFVSLVPKAYPFHRDPVHFKDYISQTFPPFANCTLGVSHGIMAGRTEEIGCHLTNMELYEKLFLFFWFLIYFLIVTTLSHCIFIIMMLVPSLKYKYISTVRPHLSPFPSNQLIANTIHNFSIGDIYMLYRLKQHLKPKRYYELLLNLNNSKFSSNSIQESVLQDPKLSALANTIRRRNLDLKNSQLGVTDLSYPDLKASPEATNFMQAFLDNSKGKEVRSQKFVKHEQKTNTSILID